MRGSPEGAFRDVTLRGRRTVRFRGAFPGRTSPKLFEVLRSSSIIRSKCVTSLEHQGMILTAYSFWPEVSVSLSSELIPARDKVPTMKSSAFQASSMYPSASFLFRSVMDLRVSNSYRRSTKRSDIQKRSESHRPPSGMNPLTLAGISCCLLPLLLKFFIVFLATGRT